METVTISLETYKSMEQELNKLRKEVQEKEVIRYVVWPYLLPLFMFLCLLAVASSLLIR